MWEKRLLLTWATWSTLIHAFVVNFHPKKEEETTRNDNKEEKKQQHNIAAKKYHYIWFSYILREIFWIRNNSDRDLFLLNELGNADIHRKRVFLFHYFQKNKFYDDCKYLPLPHFSVMPHRVQKKVNLLFYSIQP